MIDVAVMGATPALAARVDSIVDHIPFRDLPMIDRPYLFAAAMLARVGKPEKARAMLARYRSEMTDTSIVRVQADGVPLVCWGRSPSRRASRGKRSTNSVAATSGSTARRRTSARRACRSTSRARTTPRASRTPRR